MRAEGVGKFLLSGSTVDLQRTTKCRVKYTDKWTKLQAQASGTGATCDAARFAVSGGTVTDKLTGLQWEQKTDDATVHDKDNTYTWTAAFLGTNADGTAYSSFLATLNSGSCFAGHCDWRLPTRAELQTILLEPYPCTTSPCIDQGSFGPTTASRYWSSITTFYQPDGVWIVDFSDGDMGYFQKDGAAYARAVRGGL